MLNNRDDISQNRSRHNRIGSGSLYWLSSPRQRAHEVRGIPCDPETEGRGGKGRRLEEKQKEWVKHVDPNNKFRGKVKQRSVITILIYLLQFFPGHGSEFLELYSALADQDGLLAVLADLNAVQGGIESQREGER